ncbi:23S rRNA pseudouridine1911/1915/1917 synthase [Butyrivibrio hungatei DSM 14810]|uniref:RNA pseudouridylate synthase n=1 Tax=Butyrivibrio hungatei DSM 14810 TaxID=1121132 RepID=A0A1M7SRG0_9FIRM|nr:RluA family pseudouridine synthase [Butyrivibrio hungatei]SHN61069.1 23S rRNA pseudouridine1911/1915/1917 synthase [Butyrivibrio hungatei DSM 14810]
MKRLEYIFEDKDIIVCHKPAGMATEGARAGQMDLVSSVRNYLARKDGSKSSKPPYVGTVYRLDQPVEGVVVVCKTKQAASDLARQIKEHKTDKYYYAVCYGAVPEEKGHLSDYLIRNLDTGLAEVTENTADAKKAELDYEVLWRKKGCTLLRIKLLTGRFHQIRVQMAHMGFPIVGDQKYGNAESMGVSKELGLSNVCLCCYKFGFKHPVTKKKVSYEVEPEFLKSFDE